MTFAKTTEILRKKKDLLTLDANPRHDVHAAIGVVLYPLDQTLDFYFLLFL